MHCKAQLDFSNRRGKQRPNPCITGNAILPQTGTKLTKNSGSEFYALLWRHLTPHRKLQYAKCNRETAICARPHPGTTTIHRLHNSSKDVFRKFTSSTTFGAHNLVHSEPFLDYQYEFWHCCQRYIEFSAEKNLSRCTSTFSVLNYCNGIFFKSLSYLYEVVCTIFSADFWSFRNFWP